jgi:glycosyltransferase involved in cell wall biosynthesis
VSSSDPTVSIAWCLSLECQFGLQQGGALRYVNIAKALSALGHKVIFLLVRWRGADHSALCSFLDHLVDDGTIAAYQLVDPYSRPRWLGRVAALLIDPRVSDYLLRPWQSGMVQEVLAVAAQFSIDGVIVSDPYFFPLLASFGKKYATIVDWCDSRSLASLRGIRVAAAGRDWGRGLGLTKALWDSARQELFRGGLPDVNLYVSLVDRNFVNKWPGRSGRNRVLPNGVDLPSDWRPAASKEPNQLIFTGAMDFPPNYDAAHWFIDRVFPLVRSRVPAARFLVAGRNPQPALKACGGDGVEILGYIEGLRDLISTSRLYVAPLVSGSGFKNKVVEALAASTYVVATPMAVEFLPREVQDLLLVSRKPEDMARQIVDYLANPAAFDERLRSARKIVLNSYTWAAAASTLAGWISKAQTDR